MDKINIAIDGPAGAGKSTVAKRLADRLGYVYIDTGAMYRAVTLKAMRNQLDVHSEEQLAEMIKSSKIRLEPSPHGQKVYIDNEDVTDEIRRREVTNQVSFVASHELIRSGMLELQRKLAQDGGVVMDGRDIGTHVLPDAEVKIFLSASIDERAQRRYLELQGKGQEVSLDELKEEIKKRDKRDSERKFAPLRKAANAVEIDTTGLNIDAVVQMTLDIVQTRLSKGE